MPVTRRVLLAAVAAVPFDHWAARPRKPRRKDVYADLYTNTY